MPISKKSFTYKCMYLYDFINMLELYVLYVFNKGKKKLQMKRPNMN